MADKLALVFSGGGAKGAFGAGVLHRLVQRRPRLRWQIVSGTSTGGLIAPFASIGATDRSAIAEVGDLYKSVRERDILDSNIGLGLILTGLPLGLYNFDPLKETIRRALPPRRRRQLINGNVITILNAVNLQTGELALWTQRRNVRALRKWFKNQESKGGVGAHFLPQHKLEEAMLATSAIPAGIEPEPFSRRGANAPCRGKVDRHQLVDGGVLDLAPLRSAIAAGATDILTVFMSPRVPQPDCTKKTNLLSVALRAVDLLTDEIGRNDVDTARQVTELGGLAQVLLDARGTLPAAVEAWLGRPGHSERLTKLAGKRAVRIEVIEPAHLLGETLEFDDDVGPDWPRRKGGLPKRNIMEARFRIGVQTAADALRNRPAVVAMLRRFGG